jgi:hypothetical protein
MITRKKAARKPRTTKKRDFEREGSGYKLAEKEIDRMAGFLRGNPANLDVYDPRDNQMIPPAGSWAMITRKLPPIEGRLDENMRVGRIFFVEHLSNVDEKGFQPNGMYRAMCHSPWGDLHLWPYEYSTIDVVDIVKLWTAEEVIFHPTSIDNARFSEIAFYARSRGIGLADAAVMALGTLTGSVGWFEPREDLAAECEAMERSMHRPWRASFGRREANIKRLSVDL